MAKKLLKLFESFLWSIFVFFYSMISFKFLVFIFIDVATRGIEMSCFSAILLWKIVLPGGPQKKLPADNTTSRR